MKRAVQPNPTAWGWTAGTFARVFGLGDRTAARMMSGARAIPPPIWTALRAIQTAREAATPPDTQAAPQPPDRAA